LHQYILKFQYVVLLYLIALAPDAFAQFSNQGSNEEILRAIHRTTDLLETSRKAWVPQAYCISCHDEGLQFRLDRVAAEHGLPVDRNAENEHLRKAIGQPQARFKGIPLFGVDATARGEQLIDPAVVPGIALTLIHDLGGCPRAYPLRRQRRDW